MTTPPPESLIGALQDRIHPASGRLISTTPIRVTKCRCCNGGRPSLCLSERKKL